MCTYCLREMPSEEEGISCEITTWSDYEIYSELDHLNICISWLVFLSQ